jgi:hypothetical protein
MLVIKAQGNLGTCGIYYNEVCVACLWLPKELITLARYYWRSLHGKCGDGEMLVAMVRHGRSIILLLLVDKLIGRNHMQQNINDIKDYVFLFSNILPW